MPVKARHSEGHEGWQYPGKTWATRQACSTQPGAIKIKANPTTKAIAEVKTEYTGKLYHQCPIGFQLARPIWVTVSEGICSQGKVNYPCRRVLINTNTYLLEGSVGIQIALAMSLFTSVNWHRFWKVFSKMLCIQFASPICPRNPKDPTDLPVDHDLAPVAIEDIMYEPGAPTCAPETRPIHNSDIDIIYVKTTINPNIPETPIAIKPDPNQDLEDPPQSIISVAYEVINLDDDDEDEEPAPEAAPVIDHEPELLLITDIATPSTSYIPPIAPVDLDSNEEDIENIKQNDAEFDNMAVTEHEGGTGNDVESQVLKNDMMNYVYENWTFLPLKTSTQLHPHQIVAVDWMAEKENGLEQGGLLANDCGTGMTLTTLALICHQVNIVGRKESESQNDTTKDLLGGSPPNIDIMPKTKGTRMRKCDKMIYQAQTTPPLWI
ncbi:hypothetical protein BDD12DRAFT_923568 [Trichophaea hybrida]|nr:hypothetical protein BDD12DRAFT_923568 [Trichophaea hybrida]